MISLETKHLKLREFIEADAPFILRLLNEPSFLRFIGDKGVRNLDDARGYILNGPVASYKRHGFGLYLVELRPENSPIGMCGLLKRESLTDVDIGFAFLPEFWNQGYAFESASAVIDYGRNVLKLPRIVAITDKDNVPSGKLLEKLGMRFERFIDMTGNQDETRFFVPRDESDET